MRFMNWLRSEQSEFTFLVESQLPPHVGHTVGQIAFRIADMTITNSTCHRGGYKDVGSVERAIGDSRMLHYLNS